ncbi:hypothetical protein PVAG01_10832 [Phlyctema vagabunda]|uniref:Uncharacterized protein n=1 Tax=Phlyctema vagabunda TaxID=108571 RepID=A0ABR4P3F2_9HELO
MCLMRPRVENEVEFVDRRPIRKVYVAAPVSPRRSTTTRTRISDTVILSEPPAAQYVQAPLPAPAPAPPPPPPAPVSVPKIIMAPTPPPAPASPIPRVELVEVQEAIGASPKASRSSVSQRRRRSHASEEREVYIERERERIRGVRESPPPPPPLDTYRYVEGAPRRERSRSITYETNPRHSARLIERERVVVEDSGRRREFYQRR